MTIDTDYPEQAIKVAGEVIHKAVTDDPLNHRCTPGCRITADALALVVFDRLRHAGYEVVGPE